VQHPDIAFVGKAGAGKTTGAEFLVVAAGYSRVSFAAPLKRVARIIWGPDAERDRGLLQWLGKVIRGRDPLAWANAARSEIEERRRTQLTGATTPVVIDDLRFPNEWEMLRELGFVIVRIEADKEQRIRRLRGNGKLQDEAQLNDVSETALDDFEADYTITNNEHGDELHLAQQIKEILTREGSRV
jgi:dephospho-CoA kinase